MLKKSSLQENYMKIVLNLKEDCSVVFGGKAVVVYFNLK